MEPTSQIRGAAQLRLLIASLVAENYKAYDVPIVGVRLGLEDGTEQEAFNSKRAYMTKRLNALDFEQLRQVARLLSEVIDSDDLRKFIERRNPSDSSISRALENFDEEVISKRWEDALTRRSSDPEGAITLARTLLEDVSKWILFKNNVTVPDNADLPQLYRLVSKILRLAPDDHTEDAFKRILGSCQSVVETLGTLRNRLGDAHSPGPLRAKPNARHAELAVNLAGTMATFLVATWEARAV